MREITKPLSRLIRYLPDPSPRRAIVDTGKENFPQEQRGVVQDAENAPRPRNDLSIHLGEHWAIVGSTGSGKTFFTMKGLLEYLRLRFPHAKRYVLDSTDDPDMVTHIHAPLLVEGNTVPDVLRDPTYTLIWKPQNSILPKQYSEWFRKLNDRREPQIVIIDEIASITGEAEEGLEPLLKQLRKHGGTAVCETQEIAKVDTTIFRQMTHFIQFFINPETYDMARARSYLNIAKEEQRPPRHPYGGFYRRTRGNFPMREFRDVRDFFGNNI